MLPILYGIYLSLYLFLYNRFEIQTAIMRINQKGAFTVILAILLCIGVQPKKALAQYDDNVSYNDFYENLAPYGQWIEDPKFGYVWSPNVDGDFRPYYTNGHWAMTDYGNTWVSDYSWGWACFHYGRWTYDNYYGWLWLPGTNWGPAWVSWRTGDSYYGWAPLGPGYEFTSAYGDYSCPNDWWVFIPPQYVYTGNYYRYWYGPRGNSTIMGNTRFINNTYENNHITYVSGPRAHDVENVTHQPVQVYRIRNSSSNLRTRVHNNEIKMYRPAEIRPAAPNGQRSAAPPNVVTAPQPVRTAQPVNAGQTTPPQFRNNMPANTARQETPGNNINKTAEPAKQAPRFDNNPYEWDVNRHVAQPRPGENVPQQQQPRQQRQAPAQQQQQQPRQAPVPQQQPQRQAPQAQPQRQAPQQQPQRQAPAPAQTERKEGGRR
jgi:hypothetical protein